MERRRLTAYPVGISWVTSREGTWFGGIWLHLFRWGVLIHRANWHEPPAWWIFRRQPIRVC